MKKLRKDFYLGSDVLHIAKDLLGKVLFTRIHGITTSGMIVETEAYNGVVDKASHAYPNRITGRNAIMFEDGGVAYVYLIYGIHHLFNIVTNVKGYPDAILIRALEPREGIEVMKRRRKKPDHHRITSGPGSLSEAMGIDMNMYGMMLESDTLWLEESEYFPGSEEIISTTRVGVDYAEEDAKLPWRFYLRNNQWISRR